MLDFFRVIPRKRTVKIKKGGIIFNNPGGIMRTLFWAGNLLILGSIIYGIYLYYPLGRAIIRYELGKRGEPETPVAVYPTPTVGVIEEEIDNTYKIQIPKILAEAEIVPNISPFSPVEYLSVLKNML